MSEPNIYIAAVNPYQKDTACFTYSLEGVYTIEVMARNNLGDTTMLYTMVAQHGVTDDFIVDSTAPALFDAAVGFGKYFNSYCGSGDIQMIIDFFFTKKKIIEN